MSEGLAEFKVGDVVTFICGGPFMMVEEINYGDSDYIFLRWFNRNGEVQGQAFNTKILVKLEKQELPAPIFHMPTEGVN